MATVAQLKSWRDKWGALDQRLTDLISQYSAMGGALAFDRQTTVISLLQSLQAFADEHFGYFCDGFDQTTEFRLEESGQYSFEYVLEAILEQVEHDIEVIQRAAEDRITAGAARTALVRADQYAQEMLDPAMGAGKVPAGTTVLTYLGKSSSVRVIPYENVALVGIPAVSVPASGVFSAQTYLALAHEIGHYVFWRGRHSGELIRSYLRRTLPRSPRWCYRWSEEIFADVYGCCVAGPLIAVSSQDKQLAYSAKGFIEDDSEHPAPILRPDIYTQVVWRAELAAAPGMAWAGSLADQLTQLWENVRGVRAAGGEFTTEDAESVEVTDAISSGAVIGTQPVDQAITTILELLQSNGISMAVPGVLPTYADLDAQLVQAQYNTTAGLNVLAAAAAGTGLWIDGVKANKAAITWLPPEVWLEILDAGGWTDRWGESSPGFR